MGVSLLLSDFSSEISYIWPDIAGKQRGMIIDPLYPGAVAAAKQDEDLYELLAICDVFRIGKVREIKKAEELLKDKFKEKNYVPSH